MRMSQLLLKTLREDPADTDSAGYALLVRAGYVRRLSSGVYTFLPLGLRVLHRLSAIVRRELDAVGMQELLMPALSPLELWQQSGRAARFGTDALPALVVEGRGGTYVLGPTHEEVVTVTVGQEVESYRQLPLSVYQIQSKFRDEARPRYGLVRTKELVMCDAYSFDQDPAGMQASYDRALSAYLKIFAAVDLAVVPVVAQSGAIGGEVNHEFMVPSPIGEDHFARCSSCGYSANTEAAVRRAPEAAEAEAVAELGEVATPGAKTMEQVVEAMASRGIALEAMLKTVATIDDEGRLTLISVPGDREVRLPQGWALADEAALVAAGLVAGSMGPQGHGGRVRVVVDLAVAARPGPWVAGANREGFHVTNLIFGRDAEADAVASVVEVRNGDGCPSCAGQLELVRSVEAAHTFQLGLTYTTKFDQASYLDEQGASQPMWMGCYGIGVSRLLGVLAEAHHDDQGLRWPSAISPYDVHLVSLGAQRDPAVAPAAEAVLEALESAGVSVLYDDRDASPGVKFADADLLGIPLRIVVGGKGVARGVAEYRFRDSSGEGEVPLAEVATVLRP